MSEKTQIAVTSILNSTKKPYLRAMISKTTYQQSSLRSANGGYRYFFNGQESDTKKNGTSG